MNKKFSLIHTGGPYGDECSTYDGYIKTPMTVEDFIEEVLNNHSDEWGTIYLAPHDVIEYSHGEIKSMPKNFLDYKNKEIESFFAHGGWSLMDYSLHFKL